MAHKKSKSHKGGHARSKTPFARSSSAHAKKNTPFKRGGVRR